MMINFVHHASQYSTEELPQSWQELHSTWIVIAEKISHFLLSISHHEVPCKALDIHLAYNILFDQEHSSPKLVWKYCAAQMIVSFCASPKYSDEIIEWVKQSNTFDKTLQGIKDTLVIHPEYAELLLKTLVAHMQYSLVKDDYLLNHFQAEQGYATLKELLKHSPTFVLVTYIHPRKEP